MALKWIQQNIASFGGDANNVTIFGESAGGCSVHYHLLSDMSKGLFHKAIAMSGTVLNPWSMIVIKNLTERLAKAVGWNGEGGSEQLLKVLQTSKADAIIKAQDTLLTADVKLNGFIGKKKKS